MMLHCGKMEVVLTEYPDNHFDSCVTDPPYGLKFMGKKWDYDVPSVEQWKEIYRVLKPGAFLLAFGGTRTYHRLVVNIEDAGLEIRDQIQWIYGSGFPKSMNIGKAIDKLHGTEREVIKRVRVDGKKPGRVITGFGNGDPRWTDKGTSEWEGWGTALKPANEPICLARKPLSEKTVALNVLKWGTGGINVDGCRVGTESMPEQIRGKSDPRWRTCVEGGVTPEHQGRFPANVIHDGSEEVVGLFPSPHGAGHKRDGGLSKDGSSMFCGNHDGNGTRIGDSGSAARFFYCAKASKSERRDSKHPTIKPLALMKYLCKLITPPNGIILDPFMGSGATVEAGQMLGYRVVGIDKDETSYHDASKRLAQEVLNL